MLCKKDGRLVPYRRDRLIESVTVAMKAAGHPNTGFASQLAQTIADDIESRFSDDIPTTKDMREHVAQLLRKARQDDAAELFLAYSARLALRRAGLRIIPDREGRFDLERTGRLWRWNRSRFASQFATVCDVPLETSLDVCRKVERKLLAGNINPVTLTALLELCDIELLKMGLGRKALRISRSSDASSRSRVRSSKTVHSHDKRFREIVADAADLAQATDVRNIRCRGLAGQLSGVVEGVRKLLAVSCTVTLRMDGLLGKRKRPERAAALLSDMLRVALRYPARTTLELSAKHSPEGLARVAACAASDAPGIRLVGSRKEIESAVKCFGAAAVSGASLEICSHGSSPSAVRTVPFSVPYIELAGKEGSRELFSQTLQKLRQRCDEFKRIPANAETESEIWIMERVRKTEVVAVEAIGLAEAALFSCVGSSQGSQTHVSEGVRIWERYSNELEEWA
ncbi:MAG: ATP cone domain-containing protein [Planctomycetota bacterium]|nr:ATP cone domain-containing protein [Planctomycetota bacterium]